MPERRKYYPEDSVKKEVLPNSEVALDIHNTTIHDGGVAILTPDGNFIAIASERIGPREKHSGDSQLAYDFMRQRLAKEGLVFGGPKDKFSPGYEKVQPLYHHLAHAASAFYPSGFDQAGVLVIDGYGRDPEGKLNSTTIWKGNAEDLVLLEKNAEDAFATQSLGIFYSAITYYVGMGFLQEGKTMGLASYGEKTKIYDWLKQYVQIESDGSYHIDPTFSKAMILLSSQADFIAKTFLFKEPEPEILKTMEEIKLFLGEPRQSSMDVSKRDMDLAWAGQAILEEVVLGLAMKTKEMTGSDYLCLSGGVALNSVANGKLVASGMFKDIFIQPAAADDGQALGRLMYRLHNEYDMDRFYTMNNAYLGPEYSETEIKTAIESFGSRIIAQELPTNALIERTVDALETQHIVGWFQGRSEIGPRALGHRSILADPRPEQMRDHINFNVKHREWFRPLAPSVLEERANEFFEMHAPSPYMLVVSQIRPEKMAQIPAVSHVDSTARVQTVNEKDNGIYYDLIKAFGERTGIPLVLNTSFNNAGEPIVETPENAIRSFLNMNIDYLVIGNYFIQKNT